MGNDVHAKRGNRHAMAWLGVLLIGAIPVLACWHCALLVVDIPWGDQLTLLRDSNVFGGVSVGSLMRFHNEHLILPTRLAVAADYWLSGGSNALPAACAIVFTLGIVAIETVMFRRSHRDVLGVRLALAIALLTAVLLNGRMTWTLTCPILLQHVSANFFVVAALAAYSCLVNGDPSHRKICWVACLTAVAAAAVSSASGVLALPAAGAASVIALCGASAMRKRAWLRPVLFALIGGAFIVATYATAHAQFGDSHGTAAPSLMRAVRFAIYFPGGAWFRDGTWPIVHHADPLLLHLVVLGFWALLAAVLVRIWHGRDQVGEFHLFHLATLAFVVMTAGAGGLFRGGVSEMEALNNKYVPTALLAWAALVSLALPMLLKWIAHRPRWLGAMATCGGILSCAAILPGDMVEYRAWASHNLDIRCAADAYVNGVRNDYVMRRFFPSPEMARDLLSQVQQANAYFFRHRDRSRHDERPIGEIEFGSQMSRQPDHRDYGLEFMNDVNSPLGKPAPTLRASQAMVLSGWAVDRGEATCASRVIALVGERTLPAIYGLPRPDVAAFFSELAYANSGFQIVLPPDLLAPGRHEIRLRIVLANGADFLETTAYPVDVEP